MSVILSLTLCPSLVTARQSNLRGAVENCVGPLYGEGEGAGFKQSARPAGGIVEEVVIEGNRRLTAEEILRRIRTRQGETFKEATLRRDIQALRGIELLDPAQTRVATGPGLRGGVVVVFTVSERPIIRSLAFEGLRGVSEAGVLAALRRRVGVSPETPYNPARVAAAKRVILKLLSARGRAGASVEARVRTLSETAVELTFVVGEGAPARSF
ncbi:MAG: hypothetical protein M3416_11690 [Acidobacteriota bacterium]|nr:hypothetical protein [Acidobacteriota bacterium]